MPAGPDLKIVKVGLYPEHLAFVQQFPRGDGSEVVRLALEYLQRQMRKIHLSHITDVDQLRRELKLEG